MRKYMQKLLPAFVAGKSEFAKSAHCVCGVFYSYKTPIAKLCNGKVLLNVRKYSQTTSTQQGAIGFFCAMNNIEVIECNSDFSPINV